MPVTEHEHFKAKIIKTPLGKTFLDFGQNMAGYVEFSVKAKAGQKILLRYGEYIDKDGEFTQKNFQLSIRNYTTPLQQTEYICRDGENRYKPKFSIFGFRYVQIESDIEINPEDFTAIAVYSDLETTGAFSCSNTLINKFFENTVWSAKAICAICQQTARQESGMDGQEMHRYSAQQLVICLITIPLRSSI